MGRQRTGRITDLGDNRFRVVIQTRKNGKRGYFGETVTGTKADAEKFLAAALERIAFYEQNPTASLTVAGLMRKFIVFIKTQVKAKTAEDYENNLRRYIAPAIGEQLQSQFKVRDAREFYEYLQTERKLTARTVRKIHFQLKGAFRYAVEMEYRADNPLAFILR